MGNKLCPSFGKGRKRNSFKLTQIDEVGRPVRKKSAPQHSKSSKYAIESPKKETSSPSESPINKHASPIKIEEDEEVIITISDATESKINNLEKPSACHENPGFESSSDEDSLKENETQSTELQTKLTQLEVRNLDEVHFRTTPDSSVVSIRGSCNSDVYEYEFKPEENEVEDEDAEILNRTVRSIEEEIVTTATSKEIAEMTTKEDQFEDIMQKLEQMVNETTSLLEKTKYRESVHDESLLVFMDFIRKGSKDDESNQIISEMEEKEKENQQKSRTLNKQIAKKLADEDLSSADCWHLLSEHKKIVKDATKRRLEERQRLLGKLREKLKTRNDFKELKEANESEIEETSRRQEVVEMDEDNAKNEECKDLKEKDMVEISHSGEVEQSQSDPAANQIIEKADVHAQNSHEDSNRSSITSSSSSLSMAKEETMDKGENPGNSAINSDSCDKQQNQFSVSFDISQAGVLKPDEKLEHLLELNTVNAICRENITKNDIATVLSNYQEERNRIGKLREAERNRVLESVQMKLFEKRTVVSQEMEGIGEELEKILRNSTDQTQIRELVRTQLQNL